jgi:hypothetical protein
MTRRSALAEVVGNEAGEARYGFYRPDSSERDRADWYERRYEEAIADRDAALDRARQIEAAALATSIEASEHQKALAQALTQLLDATRKRVGYSPMVFLARTRARAALDGLNQSGGGSSPRSSEPSHLLLGQRRRERRRQRADAAAALERRGSRPPGATLEAGL